MSGRRGGENVLDFSSFIPDSVGPTQIWNAVKKTPTSEFCHCLLTILEADSSCEYTFVSLASIKKQWTINQKETYNNCISFMLSRH